MKVELINHTQDAEDLLIFTKQTRRLSDATNVMDEIRQMTHAEKEKHLHDVFTTIRSSWEFVDYVFVFRDVTRAFTHQLVRHRQASYAQQSMRIAPMEGFTYLAEGDADESEEYHECMKDINVSYERLLRDGVDIQDARGILPTNIHTAIVAKFNLRTLNGICNLRLCTRAHGEIQRATKMMRDLVLEIHPWAAPALLPACLDSGSCIFPRHGQAGHCPLYKDWMTPKPVNKIHAQMEWEELVGCTSPQPKVVDDEGEKS